MRKSSRQRSLALRVLRGTKSHPDAAWVHERMRHEISNVSLATVYRNLSQLVEDGLAVRVPGAGSSERFDADCSPHYHFICNRCRCVHDVEMDWKKELEREACSSSGHEVQAHAILFSGICSACAAGNDGTAQN